MSKFALFDGNGLPQGFYSEELHGEFGSDDGGIPEDAVMITDDQWREFIEHPGTRRWDGVKLVNYDPPARHATGEDVNAERGRRIMAGKVIDGVHVTGSDEDARNLMSLALGAQLRLASGDTETVTTFRDGGNVDHELTPAQLLSLWQQSAAYVSDLYAASWALKAVEPIPADYVSDDHWPSIAV